MENKKGKIKNSSLVIILAALVAVPFFSSQTFDRFFSFIRGQDQAQTSTVVARSDRCDDSFGNGGGPGPAYQNYDACKSDMASRRGSCYQCCLETYDDDHLGGQQCADNCSSQYDWFIKWECCQRFPTSSECTASPKVEVIRN